MSKQTFYDVVNGVARFSHAVSARLEDARKLPRLRARQSLRGIAARLEESLQPVAVDATYRLTTRAAIIRAHRAQSRAVRHAAPARRLALRRPDPSTRWVIVAVLTSLLGSVVAAALTLSSRRRHVQSTP